MIKQRIFEQFEFRAKSVNSCIFQRILRQIWVLLARHEKMSWVNTQLDHCKILETELRLIQHNWDLTHATLDWGIRTLKKSAKFKLFKDFQFYWRSWSQNWCLSSFLLAVSAFKLEFLLYLYSVEGPPHFGVDFWWSVFLHPDCLQGQLVVWVACYLHSDPKFEFHLEIHSLGKTRLQNLLKMGSN